MTELLSYIAQNLVDNPERVEVTEKRHGSDITLELRVDKADMGKVIGRSGRIAREIRSIIRVAGQKRGLNVSVDILD